MGQKQETLVKELLSMQQRWRQLQRQALFQKASLQEPQDKHPLKLQPQLQQ